MKLRVKQFFHSIIYSILIALLVSFFAIFFNLSVHKTIDFINQHLMYSFSYILLPILASLITWGLYSYYLDHDYSGLGIVQVLVELEFIKTFLMKPISILINFFGAFISLVFGMSVGRFGPVVHLGASVGSNVAHYFKLDDEDIRLLVGCGAAAAITSAFKIPFFATVFVLEVLYKKHFYELLTPVLLSSVTALMLSNIFSSNTFLNLPYNQLLNLSIIDYLYLLIFGVIMGLVSILVIESISKATTLFSKMKTSLFRYLIAALIVGVISFLLPLNFEIHENTTYRVLSGEFNSQILILILLAKLFTTAITLGAGYIGGNFYPAVTIGATVGMIYDKLLIGLNGNINSQGIFGLVGVGAIIASSFNAPISGIILILEISKSYELILPSILVVSIAVSIVYFLYRKDIFTKQYINLVNYCKKARG
jgi:CIC family chloride channel protein